MPVKYFAPKVTVNLCIIDFSILEITVVKIMFVPTTAIYTPGPGLRKGRFGLWYLTPLSTTFQLYRSCQFY